MNGRRRRREGERRASDARSSHAPAGRDPLRASSSAFVKWGQGTIVHPRSPTLRGRNCPPPVPTPWIQTVLTQSDDEEGDRRTRARRPSGNGAHTAAGMSGRHLREKIPSFLLSRASVVDWGRTHEVCEKRALDAQQARVRLIMCGHTYTLPLEVTASILGCASVRHLV